MDNQLAKHCKADIAVTLYQPQVVLVLLCSATGGGGLGYCACVQRIAVTLQEE
jgi:hypothetical protein